LDLLSSLVDKSLVTKEDAKGFACYRLHETMREFAAIKLRESGEEEPVELQCAEYFRSRCALSALEGRYRLLEWLPWADLEIDNIRAVLQRCLARADAPRGIDLATSLGWYWITRAASEGMRWLDGLLAVDGGNRETRTWAYFIRGFLAVLKADPAAARPALQAAVATARQTGQRDALSEALSMASIAENLAGDRASARRLLDEAQGTISPAYPPGALAVLQARALNGFFEADLGAVRAAASEGAHLSRKTGDLYGLEMMLLDLGSAALIAGALDEAKPLIAESLRIAHQIDDRVAQFYLLGACGCHAALSGQARHAAHLLGAADTVRTEAGANVMPFLAQLLAQASESAIAALGAARFTAEFDAGKRLDRDTALALALGKPAQDAVAASGDAGAGLLGKREADVARLVADGLTNKQIGTRLFISERTVDSHVRNILNKLGFNSRAQIAAWMASPNPPT
jgi:DNA-binding CsgD family transcriptional regulator